MGVRERGRPVGAEAPLHQVGMATDMAESKVRHVVFDHRGLVTWDSGEIGYFGERVVRLARRAQDVPPGGWALTLVDDVPLLEGPVVAFDPSPGDDAIAPRERAPTSWDQVLRRLDAGRISATGAGARARSSPRR